MDDYFFNEIKSHPPCATARFHLGTVPAGRYATSRRGVSDCGPAWVRPRQARPSRMTPRDFTSEPFRRVDTRRLGAGCPTAARPRYGRDKRGPPVSVCYRAISLRNRSGGSIRGVSVRGVRLRPGLGAAATSAALPHDAARFHFGTVPAGGAQLVATTLFLQNSISLHGQFSIYRPGNETC